jgi:putative Ca2+/H+ antiporter (TMEM165/GDT1 family)
MESRRACIVPVLVRLSPHEAPMNHLILVFTTVFLAELGDKTQLATLLFAADRQHSALLTFVSASAALVTSAALAVALGHGAERLLHVLPLKLIAGLGFIAVGLATVWSHFQS